MKDKGKNFLFVVNFINQSISFTPEKATDENHLRVQIKKKKSFQQNETLDWDRHRMYFWQLRHKLLTFLVSVRT